MFSDEEVLNLESSDSEVSDSEAGYDPEDERILSRIRKTIEEKIAHGGEVEEDGEEASREKSL